MTYPFSSGCKQREARKLQSDLSNPYVLLPSAQPFRGVWKPLINSFSIIVHTNYLHNRNSEMRSWSAAGGRLVWMHPVNTSINEEVYQMHKVELFTALHDVQFHHSAGWWGWRGVVIWNALTANSRSSPASSLHLSAVSGVRVCKRFSGPRPRWKSWNTFSCSPENRSSPPVSRYPPPMHSIDKKIFDIHQAC